jgi:hypothetical protein
LQKSSSGCRVGRQGVSPIRGPGRLGTDNRQSISTRGTSRSGPFVSCVLLRPGFVKIHQVGSTRLKTKGEGCFFLPIMGLLKRIQISRRPLIRGIADSVVSVLPIPCPTILFSSYFGHSHFKMCIRAEPISTTQYLHGRSPCTTPLLLLSLPFTPPPLPPLFILVNAQVVLPVSVSPCSPRCRWRTRTAEAGVLISPHSISYQDQENRESGTRLLHAFSFHTLSFQITYNWGCLLTVLFVGCRQKCDRKFPQCTACKKSRRGLECNFEAGHAIPQPRPKSLPKGEACAPCR